VNDDTPKNTPRAQRKIAAAGGILLCLFALSYFVDLRNGLTLLVEYLRGFGATGLVALSAFYVVACVLMLPGSLLTLGAGWLAAAIWPENPALALAGGTAAVSVGSVAGATTAFLLGRTLMRDWVAERIAGNARFSRLDTAIGVHGFKMTLLVRLSPAFPFNLLNYALGLTRVSLRDYVLASWIGMLPGTIMYVYLGATIATLSSRPEAGGYGRTLLLLAGHAATVVLVVLITRIARKALNEAVADDAPQDRSEAHAAK